MIRRAGNERRVLLDGHGYGLLQFVLAFTISGGLLMIDMSSPSFLL